MKHFVAFGILALCAFFTLAQPPSLSSANLTSVKDTLSTSRLSYHARVDSTGTAAGSSQVTVQTSAGADTAASQANSVSTAGLKAGDTLKIGSSAPNAYTVVGILSATVFTVSPVLSAGDADNNDPIYMNIQPIQTVTFTTATAVANGFFQILLPADTTTPNDALADDAGYDLLSTTNNTVSVTGTDVGSTYDFVTGVSTESGDTGCTAPANYHCLEVHYSGAGAVGQAISITIGTNSTDTPIAPAASTTHTEATADTYPFIVKNFAAGSNPNSASPVDTSTGRLAHIESVRVSATVDPTISFTITGVAAAQTRCGASTTVATDTGTNAPLAVPFGTMTLNTFKTLAHQLTVSTNATGGYAVTAAENDQLGKDGATTPFIPDTACDSGPCTHTTPQDWNTATNNGFGYSLQNVDAATIAFQYNDSSRVFNSKQFAALIESEVPQSLFSSTTVADAQDIYVCYRLSVGATQAAGNYENQITYTATGTF